MHPAGVPELAHACVDNGVTGLPALPGVKVATVRLPGKVGKLFSQRQLWRVWKMEEQVMGKLSPAEFVAIKANRFSGSRALVDRSLFSNRGPDAPDADFAEMQVRRKARRADEIRPVPVLPIAIGGPVEEAIQGLESARFSGPPVSEAPSPVEPSCSQALLAHSLRTVQLAERLQH